MDENTDLSKKIEKIAQEIQPALYEQSFDKSAKYKDVKNDWNDKILKITMTIKDEYPELSNFLNEMPVTIPDEENPEITLNNLKVYYDSLNNLLSKYIMEHEIKS